MKEGTPKKPGRLFSILSLHEIHAPREKQESNPLLLIFTPQACEDFPWKLGQWEGLCGAR